jgi:hypothetical protein
MPGILMHILFNPCSAILVYFWICSALGLDATNAVFVRGLCYCWINSRLVFGVKSQLLWCHKHNRSVSWFETIPQANTVKAVLKKKIIGSFGLKMFIQVEGVAQVPWLDSPTTKGKINHGGADYTLSSCVENVCLFPKHRIWRWRKYI